MHAGLAQRLDKSAQHVPSVGHSLAVTTCSEDSARCVVRRHDEQPLGRRVGPAPLSYRLQEMLGLGPAELVEI
jgi:hypothetical protein